MTKATQGPAKRRYAPRLPVEKRREHLLDAALRLLARDGYDKLTVEAIAREADVTRPVVYSAYDGLEPLLNALLDRTQRCALASSIQLLPHYPPNDVDVWLDPESTQDDLFAAIADPAPELTWHAVDKRVGNVRNNDEGLIEPAEG